MRAHTYIDAASFDPRTGVLLFSGLATGILNGSVDDPLALVKPGVLGLGGCVPAEASK